MGRMLVPYFNCSKQEVIEMGKILPRCHTWHYFRNEPGLKLEKPKQKSHSKRANKSVGFIIYHFISLCFTAFSQAALYSILTVSMATTDWVKWSEMRRASWGKQWCLLSVSQIGCITLPQQVIFIYFLVLETRKLCVLLTYYIQFVLRHYRWLVLRTLPPLCILCLSVSLLSAGFCVLTMTAFVRLSPWSRKYTVNPHWHSV